VDGDLLREPHAVEAGAYPEIAIVALQDSVWKQVDEGVLIATFNRTLGIYRTSVRYSRRYADGGDRDIDGSASNAKLALIPDLDSQSAARLPNW
jgi:hypothetical protein